jgi:hypothetical protein
MENLNFNHQNVTRKDILTFSPLYYRMLKEIKNKLGENTVADLFLGRVSDTGISIAETTKFFGVVFVNENQIKAYYYHDHYSADGEPLPIEKTIRFDNPFGEIPILPGYEKLPKFFLIGDELELYQAFLKQVKNFLPDKLGKNIQLRYKNDDGTLSVIHGTVVEVNKSNILMNDYHETLIHEGKTVTANILENRTKNHRFISGNGYLCFVGNPIFSKNTNRFDDGEVFGKENTWNSFVQNIA